MKPCVSYWAALLPCVCAPVYAVDGVLEPVIVAATRVEQQLSDVLPSASVISRDEIERSQASTFIDLIQSQPGIEIGRNGGPGTLSSIFMRGQASSSVAVFVDGVRVQTDAFGGLKLVDIPPSQIERIEILRGQMGAIYGEAATGGSIHIVTRSGSGASGPTASVTYGSRHTSDVSLGYTLKGDEFRWGVAVQRFDTAGYSAMNPTQNARVNPDDDAFRRESVFVNAERVWGSRAALGLQANQIDSTIAYDGGFFPDTRATTHHSDQSSTDWTLYGRLELMPGWTSRLGLTESRFNNREFKNRTTPNGAYTGDQRSLQWTHVVRMGTDHLTFGVESVEAQFRTPATYTRDSLAYFAGYSGQRQRLDYQFNLRHDAIEGTSGANTRQQSATTWLAGAGYQVTDALKVTGLASTSFRAPNVGELFNTAFTTGNPNLEPEAHEGYEWGLSYASAAGNWRWVRFVTETRNAIAYRFGPPDYVNIGKTTNRGHEISLDGSRSGWYYKLSAVSQDPRNAITQARLARRAKEYGTAELRTSAAGTEWGAQVLWSGRRPDGATANMLPAYSVLHLTAARKLSPRWTGRVKWENALNERYQLAHGFDAVPRGVFVSLQYQPR